jgi:chaperone modulatory protein CbpM
MKTLEQVLETMQRRIDRSVLEEYIRREWIRPRQEQEGWYFEEIDIARLELVCHLSQDIEINDQGMDVVLSLLDQLYGLRTHMMHLSHAIARQQPEVQAEIVEIINQLAKTGETP